MPLLEATWSPTLNHAAESNKITPLSTKSLIQFARSGQMSRSNYQVLVSMLEGSYALTSGDRILVDCILEDVQAGLIQVLT